MKTLSNNPLFSLLNRKNEANFLSGIFSPFTFETCENSGRWLWKEGCVSNGVRKSGNTCASPTAVI